MKTLSIRRAFTLVELLVVVVIIGILASLVTVGVMAAVQAAKRSKIAMEMHQITLALETYKNKFGEYPPDLSDSAAVVRHVKRRWPRFQFPPTNANDAERHASLNRAVQNVFSNQSCSSDIRYVGALPFWLGGFPNEDGKFTGFSADPEAPFGKEITPGPTIKINNGDSSYGWTPANITLSTQDKDSVFLEMIIGKNIEFVTTAGGIVFPVLVNRDATVNKDGSTPVPYVYFKSTSSNGGKTAYAHLSEANIYLSKGYNFSIIFNTSTTLYAELGQITAYARSGISGDGQPLVWQEAERFQLIHPGLDGVFGIIRTSPEDATEIKLTDSATPKLNMSGFRSIDMNINTNDIGQHDFDNITNFSDYQQIKSILP